VDEREERRKKKNEKYEIEHKNAVNISVVRKRELFIKNLISN